MIGHALPKPTRSQHCTIARVVHFISRRTSSQKCSCNPATSQHTPPTSRLLCDYLAVYLLANGDWFRLEHQFCECTRSSAIMPYNLSDGLVYHESVVAEHNAPCACLLSIDRRKPQPKYEPYREEGARSLSRIAMRRLLYSLDLLEPETLGVLPLSVLERIWGAARHSNCNSTRVWQLFAQTQMGTRTFVRTWRTKYQPDCHQHGLPYMIDSAAMSSCWVTNLTVTDCNVPAQDLVYVAKLHNLRTIDLYNNRPRQDVAFSDRIIKSWAHAATEDGALDRLEMAFINGYQDITIGSLYHLASFPRLDTFCAQECGMTGTWTELEATTVPGWNANSRYISPDTCKLKFNDA